MHIDVEATTIAVTVDRTILFSDVVTSTKLVGSCGDQLWSRLIRRRTRMVADVDRVIDGEASFQEVHWRLVDGTCTWFTDCSDPVILHEPVAARDGPRPPVGETDG